MTDPVDTTTDAPLIVEIKAAKPRAPRITAPPFTVTTDANGDRFVELTHKPLIDTVRDAVRSLEGLYDKQPRVSVDDLFEELPELQSHLKEYGRNASLARLVRFLEQEHEQEMARVNTMLKAGMISFGALRLLLKPGTDIVIQGSHVQGARVVDARYRQSFFGSYLIVDYEYISSNGREFREVRGETSISSWRGVREVSKLNVQPIDEATRAQLTTRGEMYAQVAVGNHYREFTGHMEVYKWWSWSRMRATGRIMVDIATHEQFQESRMRGREHDGIMRSVPEDKLWMTDCYVQGFSFVTKQWGRFPVEHLAEIQFRKDAYDQLVMDPDKKIMVRALVQDSSSGFSDIIAGKGGGCIFLLHGEPGVGKTLTAEAVSELLQRPLYSVSVGELGTEPATMEKNLRQILDVAQIWNAVILLDEADIFLEKRTTGDILRNACVGVLLRLLEYHQGVMFLTTNRVRDFDPAFYSRISIALRYSNLNSTTRESIWTNLLAAAGVQGLDVAALAQHELNGRQIKNCVRIAQSLANQEGVKITMDHVQQVVSMGSQFLMDING